MVGAGRGISRRNLLLSSVALGCRSKSETVVEPAAPGVVTRPLRYWLPLDLGTVWTLEDEKGQLEIGMTQRETFAGRKALRVDRKSAGQPRQSEFWLEGPDGVRVIGYRGLVKDIVKDIVIEPPWLYLTDPIGVGQTWTADVKGNAVEWKNDAGDAGATPVSERVVVRVEAEESLRVFSSMHDALRVHYTNGKLEYRRWLAKELGIVREDMIVDGKPKYEKRLANRVTFGDSEFKRIATRTARVRLSWLQKPLTDGHLMLPARFDHQGDDWKENATMLQIDLETARDASGRQYAIATFASLRAPHDWLSVGKRFKLYLRNDVLVEGIVDEVVSH